MMAGDYEKDVKLAADQICELEARLERSTAWNGGILASYQKMYFENCIF